MPSPATDDQTDMDKIVIDAADSAKGKVIRFDADKEVVITRNGVPPANITLARNGFVATWADGYQVVLLAEGRLDAAAPVSINNTSFAFGAAVDSGAAIISGSAGVGHFHNLMQWTNEAGFMQWTADHSDSAPAFAPLPEWNLPNASVVTPVVPVIMVPNPRALNNTLPTLGTTFVAVDEEAVGSVFGGPEDLDPTNLTSGTGSNNPVQTGLLAGLNFSANGIGDIVLGAVADTGFKSLANQVIQTVWDQATHTLTGVEVGGDGTVVFTLQITHVPTGAFTFTLCAPLQHTEANTEDDLILNVVVTVTDADGDPVQGLLTLLIDDDSPVAQDDLGGTATEDGIITLSGTVLTNDATGSDTTATVASWEADPALDTYGTLTLSPNGDWSYVLDNNLAATQALNASSRLSYEVNYTMRDADGDTSSAKLALTITGTNDAPLAVTDTLTVAEDSGTTAGNLATNDTPSGDGGNVWAKASNPTNGTAVVNADGSYSYTPNANFNGSDSFTYTITDADGDVSTATVNITINSVDDLPAAVTDTLTVAEDSGATAGNLATNDTPSGDGGNVWAKASNPANGTVVVNANGSYSYTPNANFNGSDSFTYTITDADGDVSTATVIITVNPEGVTNAAPVVTAATTTVSEEGLLGGNADTTGTPSDTTNLKNITGSISLSDANGDTMTVTLSGPSGLSSGGVAVTWSGNGTAASPLVGTAGATTVATITITSATSSAANYSVLLSAPLDHATTGVEDTRSFSVGVQVSDGSATTNSTLTVTVEDDSAVINSFTSVLLNSTSTPTGSGTFDYDIGADARSTYSATNSDFSGFSLGGTVGGVAVSGSSVTWVSESASSAVFGIQFTYQQSIGSTAAAAGAVTFDKAAGTYSVVLNAPLMDVSSATTASGTFTGYLPGTSTVDSTQPEVSVGILSGGVIVQFTGFAESGGGTVLNNLQAGSTAPTVLTDGELFSQGAAWVSTSNTASGVSGDTLQSGEVFDLDFFSTNPFGNTALAPNMAKEGIFLTFDGIGNTEDLVIILKLVDPDDGTRTTKAVVVDNGDIFRNGQTLPAGFAMTLDSNDGLVVIESNDYNLAIGENWKIEGLQVMVSTEDVTGTGINLNRDGASSTTQALGAATTDGDVIKITAIVFLTTSQVLAASLNLSFTVVDADGDATATQTLNILSSAAPVVLDMDGDGLEFTSLADSHALFDYNGDGVVEKSAWISGDDVFLVYDANADRMANDGSEIAFTQYHPEAQTDLEGLRLTFDSNHDGLLDANDAEFSKFGVWQDADGDGVTDSGEFHTLTEAGIASLNLVSDGQSYLAANGDVKVFGEAEFTYADGSVGVLGDVALAYSALPPLNELLTMDDSVDALFANLGASVESSSVAADGDALAAAAVPTSVAESALAADDWLAVSVPETLAPIDDLPPAVV